MASRPNRLIAAVELLRTEALELEQRFNERYPVFVQEGRVLSLLTLSSRIALIRHLAHQIEAI